MSHPGEPKSPEEKKGSPGLPTAAYAVEMVSQQFIGLFGERSVPIVLVSLGISVALLSTAFRYETPGQWSQTDFLALLAFGALLAVLGCSERVVRPMVRVARGRIHLDSVTPPVATPGDYVRIDGVNFGDRTQDSAVMLNGDRRDVPDGFWSDTTIMFAVPDRARDGHAWRPGERLILQVVAAGQLSSNLWILTVG